MKSSTETDEFISTSQKNTFYDEYIGTIKEIKQLIPENIRHIYYPRGGDDIFWLNLGCELFIEDIYGSLKNQHPNFRKTEKERPKTINEFLPDLKREGFIPNDAKINILKGNCDDSSMGNTSNRPDFCLIYKPHETAAPKLLEHIKNRDINYGAIITTGECEELDTHMTEKGYDCKSFTISHHGAKHIESKNRNKKLRPIVPEVLALYTKKVSEYTAPFEVPKDYTYRDGILTQKNLFDGEHEYLYDHVKQRYVRDTRFQEIIEKITVFLKVFLENRYYNI